MLAVLIAATLSALQPNAAMTAEQRQLAAELEADVRDYRASLPSTEGPLTITAVRLRGIEIIYDGVVAADFGPANIAAFRRAVREGLCTGDTLALIRRGGSFTYDLRDQGGERFVTTISSCD